MRYFIFYYRGEGLDGKSVMGAYATCGTEFPLGRELISKICQSDALRNGTITGFNEINEADFKRWIS